MPKNLIVESTMFPHRNGHKYTLSSDEKTHDLADSALISK